MQEMTCPLCRHVFDSSSNLACESCPLHRGCRLVCCPACGHSTVDPARTGLGRLVSRIGRRKRAGPPPQAPVARAGDARKPCVTLAAISPGSGARVSDFTGLDAHWREHLQAYGLAPGRWVQVVQHAPLTVVRIDHTDLALESRLARAILVEPFARLGPPGRPSPPAASRSR